MPPLFNLQKSLNYERGGKMKELFNTQNSNPLSDLISDEVFNTLNSRGLINEKSVRDHLIRKKFTDLKSNNYSASQAIELIRQDYPYLQFDTVRKIVYQVQK